ncbi:MAG TPA: TetR/AcrR family transcriptional regulator [Baekduia sp.]|uniref:TetR/AcrR family transcriptional regulator n=1 Tax=Baekduia sp. TaxID=2600305 RepID=UPI002C6D88D8|nr:TetR/AcrR family transcriptional regulator [Baekduia sp.]HMJ37278.1 TetR/AcrR family transcriptional regulator [Baekduia sp.]
MARAEPADDAPRRGRPRSQKTRQAILEATSDLLLEHGLGSISMDTVAERAGASKATIYRWWPSKELLALDALFSEWETARPDTPDTGSLDGDLLALVGPWIHQVAQRPYGRVIAALVVRAQTDPQFAQAYSARFLQPRRDEVRVIFDRAIERGDIPADTDVEAAIDLVYGPFYHRMLQGHAPNTDGFARTVVAYVVAGVSGPAVRAE